MGGTEERAEVVHLGKGATSRSTAQAAQTLEPWCFDLE